MERLDVLIAGGGPAGLACGVLLARRGLKVVVCEQASYPVDKPCGEGIMPLGVRHLLELGVRFRECRPFSGIHYRFQGLEAVGSFREGDGLGVDRRELSRALLEVAQATPGLEVRPATRATPTRHAPGGIEVQAGSRAALTRLLVGSDGLNSRVRAWAGLEGPAASWKRWGARARFAVAPWSARVEVHWSHGMEAYVTPVSEGHVGVAFCWDRNLHGTVPGRGRLLVFLLDHFPELRDRLGPPVGTFAAVGPLQRKSLRPVGPGLALVGDASGYLDPITGEGISLALSQAAALERSVADPLLQSRGRVPDGALDVYERRHRVLVRPYHAVTGTVLRLTRHPWLARRVVNALSRDPAAFAVLLSANMGLARWPDLVRRLPLFLVHLCLGSAPGGQAASPS
ncbi:MAG: NAD(P)/FAD-dependent oxidoreductase [Armatimonadetes bacterium]|nr:NAD(P)/FAD-dependent oxidoreductase [Armatimonadota bacterium]